MSATMTELGDVFKQLQEFTSGKSAYTDDIVGIIDILGFSSSLKTEANSIPQSLGEIVSHAQLEALTLSDNVNVKLLSDTLIVYAPNNLPALIEVINLLDAIFHGLLKKGYLSRGVIVSGNNYIKGDIMISPAFLEAHNIEESVCVYPRIFLKDDLYNKINDSSDNERIYKDVYGDQVIFDKKRVMPDFDGLYKIVQFTLDTLTSKTFDAFDSEINEYRQGLDIAKKKCDTKNIKVVAKINYLINILNVVKQRGT